MTNNNITDITRPFNSGDPTNYGVLVRNATTVMSVLQDITNKHKERLEETPDAERRDFVDHYLDRIKAQTEPTCTGI